MNDLRLHVNCIPMWKIYNKLCYSAKDSLVHQCPLQKIRECIIVLWKRFLNASVSHHLKSMERFMLQVRVDTWKSVLTSATTATDSATSPKTNKKRMLFGVVEVLGAVAEGVHETFCVHFTACLNEFDMWSHLNHESPNTPSPTFTVEYFTNTPFGWTLSNKMMHATITRKQKNWISWLNLTNKGIQLQRT